MSVKVKIVTKEAIERRIAELERQRLALFEEAKRQLSAHDAAIGELRALLDGSEDENDKIEDESN